jgi:hypothetical protein
MVLFFIQDEPDQTPLQIGGQEAGQYMLDRLVSAKSECGGLDCIVAGGFANVDACTVKRPIRHFLDGLTRPVNVEQLPEFAWPEDMKELMSNMLVDTLLPVITDTCEEIGPVV